MIYMKKTQVFINVVAALYIILFMYTGIYKIVRHSVFYLQLSSHRLLDGIYPIVSWTVPIVEIAVSLLLAFSVTRIKGIWASMILMTMFTIYLIYMMITSPKLPCSCGGIINLLSWNQHVIVNVSYILLSITALFLHYKKDGNRNLRVSIS